MREGDGDSNAEKAGTADTTNSALIGVETRVRGPRMAGHAARVPARAGGDQTETGAGV